MKTILAPIDFSDATQPVIDGAVELARAMDGKVVLLHIVQPPIMSSDYGLALDSFQDALRISEEHAGRRLAEIHERARTSYPNVQVERGSGAAIREILAAAERLNADYVVMGSHGHTALYDLIVGSTTHGVLRKARCPVMIVPATESARAKRR
jgi:nucleotide-binding universal stress UspA family protein